MESLEGALSYEEEILAQYSTSGLRRNELIRSAKKLNMEFDENYRHMSKAERNELLGKLFPETIDALPSQSPIE